MGVGVTVADPPDAAIPVKDGIEKNAPSQAAGANALIEASLVNVIVKGLLAFPLGPMTTGVVSACAEPDVDVAKFQLTSLVVAAQPEMAPESPEDVYPAAYVVLVGRSTPVSVTG